MRWSGRCALQRTVDVSSSQCWTWWCLTWFLAVRYGADRKHVKLRSEDAGPLVGLAAAAEEEQRKIAPGACHVVTLTPGITPGPNLVSKIPWPTPAECGTLV